MKMSQTIEERNKALVLEAFDALFNRRDYVAAGRYWSPHYIQHSAHIAPGRDGLFDLVKGRPSTLRYEPGRIFADQDYVMVHGRFSGLGQPANLIAADILRIDDGVLVEHWDVLQDEVTREQSKSGRPMFGNEFPGLTKALRENKKENNKMTSANQLSIKSGEFQIGKDLRIARLGFGAMRITGNGIWGEPADRREAIRVVRRAIQLGINFIDTADSYGPRVSEEIIAEALYPYPADLVIATKGGFDRPGPNQWVENGRPEHLKSACEGSLRRLRLDRIDLYQLHRIDPKVPAEDQLGALKDLQARGKIRHIGLSEVSIRQIQQARKIVPIVSVQNRYSLADRASEDVLEYCEQNQIGFLPWFPLAAGQLSGVDSPLIRAAEQVNATPSQVALAWLLARSPVMLPIPGTSSVQHLEENVASAGLQIDKSAMQELDLAVRAV
jgi:aryl-alcohol dehydrogenase-like predicted oxidoreductase/predicted SnoaL-like aldol condensation-catalyzing enzyme